MTDKERNKFINDIAVSVIKYAPQFNICVVSPAIAQAILESACGTSDKGKRNNFFGLKYKPNRVPIASGKFSSIGSEQRVNGSYVSKVYEWFTFNTLDEGVLGYFQFINISIYKNLKGVTDPKTYLENIRNDGYATSLNYVSNLMRVIENYDLTKYDKLLNTGGNKTMFKVAIDAGHGSQTSGKRSPDGYREHYENTYVSYYLEQILRKNNIATYKSSWDDSNPYDDVDVALGTRQKNIKNNNCDISVSVHANAFGSSWNNANGLEVYYHSTAAKANDSARLAKLVHAELIKGTKQTNRGVKTSALAMCNSAAMGTKASILVETAFMTNKAESELLKSDDFMRECAREIAQGIFNYLGVNGNVNVALTPVGGKEEASTPAPTPSVPTDSSALKFTNVVLYPSSTSKSGSVKSGTYYLWSPDVVNGRVRVTNAKNRVGVAGQVSGWVNASDAGVKTSSSTTTTTKPATKTLTKGQAVKISGKKLYASSTATTGATKTGTYYIWSTEVINNRVRVTNTKNRVGVSGQVSGWLAVADI